jgi:hypothetical protein
VHAKSVAHQGGIMHWNSTWNRREFDCNSNGGSCPAVGGLPRAPEGGLARAEARHLVRVTVIVALVIAS